jgi:cellulose synthase/poly-beta-1,6-N-acetylglucosamine synthase-like glycosyltransferase
MNLVFAVFTAGHALKDLLLAGAVMLSILLTIQSVYTLYIMLYTWDRPEAYQKAKAPERFLPPQKSFTVMLPARHEEDVIQSTIERVIRANYPLSLLEVVVICSIDDTGTIAKAQQKIAQLHRHGVDNVRVVAFKNKPINKPHGLNVGLRTTRNEVVTIFDAEDDIHPDIFNVVNTVMLEGYVPVLQCGVQLMNYQSRWYSALNVLEYFFWFKSRLHYHAHLGMTPLGGNTVFFARQVLQRVGGWDEHDLTEDADIGIRISLLGEPIRVVYDERHTRGDAAHAGPVHQAAHALEPGLLADAAQRRVEAATQAGAENHGDLHTGVSHHPGRAGILHVGLAAHDVHPETPGAHRHHAGSAVLPAGSPLHALRHRTL